MSETLKLVQLLVAKGDVLVSQHAHDRLSESGIATSEVELGACAAILVEDYPNFHLGPAVLTLQSDRSGQPIHVV